MAADNPKKIIHLRRRAKAFLQEHFGQISQMVFIEK
jgi:hypothetical protein